MKHKNAFSVTDKQCGIIYRLQGRLQRLMMRLGTFMLDRKLEPEMLPSYPQTFPHAYVRGIEGEFPTFLTS